MERSRRESQVDPPVGTDAGVAVEMAELLGEDWRGEGEVLRGDFDSEAGVAEVVDGEWWWLGGADVGVVAGCGGVFLPGRDDYQDVGLRVGFVEGGGLGEGERDEDDPD